MDDLTKIDWRSIHSNDFRHDNADGDEDRIRKKHAEFLVKDFVPSSKITGIGVYDEEVKHVAESIVMNCNMNMEVKVKPEYYF